MDVAGRRTEDVSAQHLYGIPELRSPDAEKRLRGSRGKTSRSGGNRTGPTGNHDRLDPNKVRDRRGKQVIYPHVSLIGGLRTRVHRPRLGA